MPKMTEVLRTDWGGPALIAGLAMVSMGLLNPTFVSPSNIHVLLLAIAINALIAMSQMIIIAIGQMNLSVGAIGGISAIAFAGLMQVWELGALPAALAGIMIGTMAGFANGWLIAKTRISAFIITLASLSIYKGINLGITQAQPFYQIPDVVKSLGTENLLGFIPLLVIPSILVALLLWYLLTKLPLGRNMLAAGANPAAAALSGISVDLTYISAHAISGTLAALAGILLVARLQIGQPTIGDDWLLLSFAAPVIGGAVLAGGHVSVAATVLGVVIVAIINQALVLFQIDPYLVQVVLGALILWAVGANRLRSRRPGTISRGAK